MIRVPTHSMIRVPTHSMLMMVFHAVCPPCMVPGYGQQKQPCRNHRSGCRLLTTLTNRIRLTAGCYRSIALTLYVYAVVRASVMNCGIRQNVVNKRISKGRKMNLNLNVLFEVRIFELHLTSLVGRMSWIWMSTTRGSML